MLRKCDEHGLDALRKQRIKLIKGCRSLAITQLDQSAIEHIGQTVDQGYFLPHRCKRLLHNASLTLNG